MSEGREVLLQRTRRSLTVRDAIATARIRSDLGWFAPLTVLAATGVLLVVVADAVSRSTGGNSQALFWVGLLLVYLPIVWRLTAIGALRV
ncbi:MAG: hypothetical protein QOF28_342, partial [Actinomycetota bacterium]|nr:hypothetical protein [Actinomycetota bacterium]